MREIRPDGVYEIGELTKQILAEGTTVISMLQRANFGILILNDRETLSDWTKPDFRPRRCDSAEQFVRRDNPHANHRDNAVQ